MSLIKNKIKKAFYAAVGKAEAANPSEDFMQGLQQVCKESRIANLEHQNNQPQSPPPLQANTSSCPSSTHPKSLPSSSSSSSSTKHQFTSKSQSLPSMQPASSKIMQGDQAPGLGASSKDGVPDGKDSGLSVSQANPSASSAGRSTTPSRNSSKQDGNKAVVENAKISITCSRCKKDFLWDVVKETTKALFSSAGLDPRIACPKCKRKLCHYCQETNLRRPNRNYYLASNKGAKVGICCEEGGVFLTWAVSCGVGSRPGDESGDDNSYMRAESSNAPPRRSSRLAAKSLANTQPSPKTKTKTPTKHTLKALFADKWYHDDANVSAPPEALVMPAGYSEPLKTYPNTTSTLEHLKAPPVPKPTPSGHLPPLPPMAHLLQSKSEPFPGFNYTSEDEYLDDEELENALLGEMEDTFDDEEAAGMLTAEEAAEEAAAEVCESIILAGSPLQVKEEGNAKTATMSVPPLPYSGPKPGEESATATLFAEVKGKLLEMMKNPDQESVDKDKKALAAKVAKVSPMPIDLVETLFSHTLENSSPASAHGVSFAIATGAAGPASNNQGPTKKHKLSPDSKESNKDWRRGVGYGSGSFGDGLPMPWHKRRRTVPRPTISKGSGRKNRVLELYFRALAILLRGGKGGAELDLKCKSGHTIAYMLARSPLLSTAKDLLRNTSITEMATSLDLYDGLLEFAFAASQQPLTLQVMADTILLYPWAEQLLSATRKHMADNNASLRVAIEALSVDHSQHRKVTSNGKGKGAQTPVIEEAESCVVVVGIAADSFRGFIEDSKRHQDVFKDAKDRRMAAVLDRYVELAQFYKYQGKIPGSKDEPESIATSEGPKAVAEVPDEQLEKTYSYTADAGKIVNPPPGRMKKLLTDLNSLRADLPPGIYVRHGTDRFDIIKVMIVGPQGTPYENGLFEFDMLIPAGFPSDPPKMQFKTTGRGQVAFNPNLYSNGYVCLSLLNTWSGPKWQRDSTLLQLLLSIQAMIFCEEPFYNEPGYEKHRNHGASSAKNLDLQGHTIEHAMIPWLAHVTYDLGAVRSRRKAFLTAHSPLPKMGMTINTLKPVSLPGAKQSAAQTVKDGQENKEDQVQKNGDKIKIKKEPKEKMDKFEQTPQPTVRDSNQEDSDVWDEVVRHHFSNRAEVIVEVANRWEGKRCFSELIDLFRRHHFIE